MDRLLIVKLSSLGDVVHALPVASALRRRFPAARISWAVEDWIAPLLAAHPAIDRVVAFPRLAWRAAGPSWASGVRRAVRLLQEEPYDLALDLQGLLKSAAVSLFSRAAVRLGRSRQREGAGFVSRATPAPPERAHAVEEYLHCAAAVGASRTPVEFGIRTETAAIDSVTRLLLEYGVPCDAPLITISPSASAAWKEWPIERWTGLAAALTEAATVVIVGSAAHRGTHAGIARAASGSGVVDLTAKTTLPQLVALLSRCALHVAPDTGTLHLTAALGRPVLGLYGPTLPWRLGPYGQPGGIIHHPDACIATCPRGCRGACLDAITPAEVIARARQLF